MEENNQKLQSSNQEEKESVVKRVMSLFKQVIHHKRSPKVMKVVTLFCLWLLSTIGYIRYISVYFCGYDKWKEILSTFPEILFNLLLLHVGIVIFICSLSGLMALLNGACSVDRFYLNNWLADINRMLILIILSIGLVLFFDYNRTFEQVIEIVTFEFNVIQ